MVGVIQFASEASINIIRGKNLVSKATKEDVDTLLAHITALEHVLDLGDMDDLCGTRGWRHYFKAILSSSEA